MGATGRGSSQTLAGLCVMFVQEAISKYTALELLHNVGRERGSRGARTNTDAGMLEALLRLAAGSFFWTVAIALYLYLSIVRAARGPRPDRLFWVFHGVSGHMHHLSG
ncbi:Putative G-protein coupled receptor 157 [Fukomys damarensis]|uniref:Putative G-protein coupled receptor 157 n=1 Tax=Fukomys damarensis TaxID=885580 RepID=A0A091DAX4_FUKDA|nr:Putative G-protein coupled receptor 157 [Fukomys damarensis]